MNTKNPKLIFLIIIAVIALFVFNASYFSVDETEQYVITLFGKPVRVITEAGLHFKKPLLEKAVKIEKRLLEWDGESNQIPTGDNRFLFVDTIARWRIVDPMLYIQKLGNESRAQSRLDDIIDAATREAISRNSLVETVRDTNNILGKIKKSELSDEPLPQIEFGREKIQQMILERAKPVIQEFGIELVDVRIKRLNYETSVQQKVFERMIEKQKSEANQLRSEGLGLKADIEGQMKKELNKIESEAYKAAQEIMGEADSEATAIYANAYNLDPDFYSFFQTLETYKETFDKKMVLILSADGEFLELINK